MLLEQRFTNGTLYYPSPDAFLFFFALLLHENTGSDIYCLAINTLRVRLAERTHVDTDALSLAMRLLAFQALEIPQAETLLKQLVSLQDDDGTWPSGWLCRYGKTGVRLGNRLLTTALAFKALDDSGAGCRL
ncbi:hypothetical protein B0H12DRAFT_217999 [Mycena haematopus]|nr:hypothetical protein B0H12DRAFT_217999 [Mycena haematopus]